VEKIPDCRVLTDFAELERLSSKWAALQSTGGQREIFQRFGWDEIHLGNVPDADRQDAMTGTCPGP
jgi:hypothetical protein